MEVLSFTPICLLHPPPLDGRHPLALTEEHLSNPLACWCIANAQRHACRDRGIEQHLNVRVGTVCAFFCYHLEKRRSIMTNRNSLRLSAALLLVGQLLYIVFTQFHTGGPANNHPVIFAAYAGSGIWTAVHLGQFAAMAILLAGLLALFFALDVQDATARWVGRFGAASSVVALALYGALQAVDGVANKQADV